MIRKLVHYCITFVFVLMFIAGPVGLGTALAEETEPWVLPVRPGTVEGVGVLFEVTDSEYLNVSLASTEMVAVYLSSVPSVIELRVEAADSALAAQLTLNGLVPGLEYHLYTDDLRNHAVMTSDEFGSLSWNQDLVEPHLLFLQTVPSTKTITEDGGQCNLIGVWDGVSTCTLPENGEVEESIQIVGSGITLDGNGATLLGPDGKNAGVFIPSGTGVTVKNLNITGFGNGIYLAGAENCEIRGNTIMDASDSGIKIFPKGGDVGGGNKVTGNQILSAGYGIYNMRFPNTFQRNTIRSTTYALDGNVLGTFYNNNLIGNQHPSHSLKSQDLSADLPFGGNYWASYDSPYEGCEDFDTDGFCDDPYEPLADSGNALGIDEYPWTKHDGWLDIEIFAPVDPIMFVEGGVTIEASAHFKDVDVNATHTAVEWDWGDGTTDPAEMEGEETDGVGDVSLAEHTYFATGVYEIKLTMKDDPYLSTVEESYQYVVVYDPSAGFVTGGGSIDSPAGAYVPDPGLIGQATFGFISKFYRTRTGDNNLSGNTVFEFHAADLRFTSISYNFLVVKNSKAIYRGLGYINGDASKEYGFMLTAQDLGDGDKFRIQIWDGDSESGIIYDNKIGAAANDMEAGTLINEGSIIIQTQSK